MHIFDRASVINLFSVIGGAGFFETDLSKIANQLIVDYLPENYIPLSGKLQYMDN